MVVGGKATVASLPRGYKGGGGRGTPADGGRGSGGGGGGREREGEGGVRFSDYILLKKKINVMSLLSNVYNCFVLLIK